MFDVFYIGKKPNQFAYEREVKSIAEAQELSRTRYFWIIHYLCDYSDFDFLWEPKPWEAHQRHAFASQWQKDSETYLCPKTGYTDTNYHLNIIVHRTADTSRWQIPNGIDEFDYSWHPDPSEPPFIYQFGTQWQKTGGPTFCVPGSTSTKYVSQVHVKNIAISKEVYLIDHGNKETEVVKQQIEDKGLTVKKVTRFISSYKGTLQRILSREEHEYVWVCSSICDYSKFDFSWHPELWQGTMLHVFPSDGEKFGDTFLVNTPTFNNRISSTELLEWYDTIHFVDSIDVPRWPMPVIYTDGNSIVDAVKEHTFIEPLTLFSDREVNKTPVVPLWREKTRTIVPFSTGNSVVVVPRDAKTHVFGELYDYPYIDKTYSSKLTDKPLDVVFLSNGEENATEHLDHLRRILPLTNNLHVVQNINGRLNAYRKCAELSNTPWFFVAYAKLLIDENFNWEWQPDRMQQNKHYIFHAYNPVNNLEYGHMAMIALNKKLVLSHPGTGIDFSMEQPHEVIPIRSGIAEYNKDPWMTWRTAFRETLKLIYSNSITENIDTSYRIKIWTTVANGDNAEWSLTGAADAQEYFNSVCGDFEKIRLSYEWDWLRSYFNKRYNLLSPA